MTASYAKKQRPQKFRLMVFCLLWMALPLDAAVLSHQDQNPFVRLYLPPQLAAHWAQVSHSAVEVSAFASNTLNLQGELGSGGDALRVDGEIQGFGFSYVRRIAADWVAGIELPFSSHGAGEFDHFISEYHNVLSLPDGGRAGQVQDQFNYSVQRDGELLLDVRGESSGVGDLAFFALHTIALSDVKELHWQLRLELPTGDAEKLTGSGSLDLSTSLSLQQQLSPYWRFDADVGLLWMSDGEVLRDIQNSFATFGSASIGYVWSDALLLAAQMDFHSALFDAGGLEFLDSVWLLGMGGQLDLPSNYKLLVTVGEDIQVAASPDVSVRIGLIKKIN